MRKLLPALILTIFWLTGPLDELWAKNPPGRIKIGGTATSLAGPEGLARVDGRSAKVDNYIKKAADKLNLKVLAIYAPAENWDKFVSAAAAGRPAAAPVFALLCTTTAMPEKSYDQKSLRREFRKYEQWFSLAVNNQPLAALLTSQGNQKLTEALGANIGFKFKMDKFAGRFDQGSDSLSLGARVGFNVFGEAAEVFLTASALAVGDKIVFLGYFEKDGPPEMIKEIQERSKAWRRNLSGLNAGQYAGRP